eukprot:469977_1
MTSSHIFLLWIFNYLSNASTDYLSTTNTTTEIDKSALKKHNTDDLSTTTEIDSASTDDLSTTNATIEIDKFIIDKFYNKIQSTPPQIHKFPLAYLMKQYDDSGSGILFVKFDGIIGAKTDIHINALPLNNYDIRYHIGNQTSDNRHVPSAMYCNQVFNTYLIVFGKDGIKDTDGRNSLQFVHYQFILIQWINEIDTQAEWRVSRADTDNIMTCAIKNFMFHAIKPPNPTDWNYLYDDWGLGIYNQRLLVSLTELLLEKKAIQTFLNEIETMNSTSNMSMLIDDWASKTPLQTYSFIWGSTGNALLDTIRVVDKFNSERIKSEIPNKSRVIWKTNSNCNVVVIPEWLFYAMISCIIMLLIVLCIIMFTYCFHCCNNRHNYNNGKDVKQHNQMIAELNTVISQNSKTTRNNNVVMSNRINEWSNKMTRKQNACDELESIDKQLFAEGVDEHNTNNTNNPLNYDAYQNRLVEFKI